MSVAMTCPGYGSYVVHFAEGDLRQSVTFGHAGVGPRRDYWQSFVEWNSVNDTIEWRLEDGRPFATILRWFIENVDPNTGTPEDSQGGEILVVSRVAQREPEEACVVGYVDARANGQANEIARRVADEIARNFDCERDEPRYHGERGPYSGNPS
ncbi:hypothetical protein HPQ64_09475 [Rhizobiales bacterium]|uniref:hypothetical protein n=1 Tax=Hongsoonwoonella zoysiae TaxID=2821844 RepID=UPI001560501A|nr:hypothetical protein [Hongsoonwoonella zoysiae]NRG17917.1 hypothetical protein [Hongsoonwoonella zoysiae]